MKEVLAIFFILVYNISLIGGTVYLIDARGWSPWWIILPILMMLDFKGSTK